jgi:hypothetical protein
VERHAEEVFDMRLSPAPADVAMPEAAATAVR